MTRILQKPEFTTSPTDVPAPPAWDSVALAAYEQGFAEGTTAGRELGRRDVAVVDGHLGDAVDRCLAAVDASAAALQQRVLDAAELFVTTVLRHVPEARTAGLLVRLGEVLAVFDPGELTVAVHPELVADVTAAVGRRGSASQSIAVTGDRTLALGEFRVHSEWADADGTFDRYIAAAREALEIHLALDPR